MTIRNHDLYYRVIITMVTIINHLECTISSVVMMSLSLAVWDHVSVSMKTVTDGQEVTHLIFAVLEKRNVCSGIRTRSQCSSLTV